ncbi:DEAD/DEAH box helicase [Anaerophilus nitritogenes]|uniref:DEAD/DEAH box helicase n=1 Tax=Anaerophilus nitritogenes TaxID=2498136 RepID=UPI00101C0B55|nr:DEAD/DEAH box helicase [Anaerophilus nitritogenes]
MIRIEQNADNSLLDIRFNYNDEYIRKIKKIPQAFFDPNEKKWIIDKSYIYILEKLFEGEFMYITPRWILLDESVPNYTEMYKEIPILKVALKKPYKPHKFQMFGINFIHKKIIEYGFACLFDDMGLGKTLQAIGVTRLLSKNILNFNKKYDIPFLIVCKAGLKYQWKEEGVEKFTKLSSVIIEGTAKKRKSLYENAIKKHIPYIITNYESLRKDIEFIREFKVGCLICDEAHKIRNRETVSHKAVKKVQKEYALFMTGSPINKDPCGIFSLCEIGNEDFIGNHEEYEKRYVTKIYGLYGVEKFYKNLEEFRLKIEQIALRRTEREVAIEMPKIIEQDIYIDMTKNQREIDHYLAVEMSLAVNELAKIVKVIRSEKYVFMAPEEIEEIEQQRKNLDSKVRMFLTFRLQCSDSPELFKMSESDYVHKNIVSLIKSNNSGKLNYLVEHVEELIESGHKVVVFSQYARMVKLISIALKKHKTVVFTGKMSAAQKNEAVNAFKKNPQVKCFISTNAGAEGLNLQNAKYLINYDIDRDISINDQRNKRIRRVDSMFEKVFVYNYISKDSIDENIVEANKDKKQVFDYLIENNLEKSEALKELSL